MDKSRDSLTKKLKSYPAYGIWIVVFCFVPLYFEQAYFNMSQAKAHIYNSCSVFLLILISGIYIYRRFSGAAGSNNIRSNDNGGGQTVNLSVLCFASLGLMGIVSCLFSGSAAVSFWGYDGWGMGAFAILTFNLFLMIMRKELDPGTGMWIPVMSVNAVISVLSLLHSAGIDVMNMHNGVSSGKYFLYTSTLGNINWYSGYLCLIVPLFAMIYISGSSKIKKGILAAFLFLSFLSCALSTSDSIYVSMGVCSFLAVPYITLRPERLGRLFKCIIMYGTALSAAVLLPCYKLRIKNSNGLTRIMLDSPVCIVLIISGIAGLAAIKLWGKEHSGRIRKICSCILYALPSAAGVYYAADTVRNYSDTWGSSRGYIWRNCAELFRSLSLSRKLTGVGPGMLKYYLTDVFPGVILNSAHNEPFQFLLTTGIIGLLLWLGAWGSLFASYFRSKGWHNDSAVYIVPLAAFFGHSMLNSSNICCYGILCAITACYLNYCDKQHSETIIE